MKREQLIIPFWLGRELRIMCEVYDVGLCELIRRIIYSAIINKTTNIDMNIHETTLEYEARKKVDI